MMVQELSGRLTRSLRFPVSDPVSLSAVTPNAQSRANRYLAFDANGAPVATAGPAGDSSIPVSPFMETMLDDADAATARATLGAAGTADINSFTKIQKWAKGADVASANALTLGDDGNYFEITGSTVVEAINTKGIGTVVKLHFGAAFVLTHHATDLILPDGQNITTRAGDEIELVEYATGKWRCTNYLGLFGSVLRPGIYELATPAEVEAETANGGTGAALVVKPDDIKRSPGVAKAHGFVDRDGGTPTLVGTSYNITSVTDDGASQTIVTLDTDMSGAIYAAGASPVTSLAIRATVHMLAAGSFKVTCFNNDGSTGATSDTTDFTCWAFGDQA